MPFIQNNEKKDEKKKTFKIMFVHPKGDVSELDLTFSVDEDQMGKIVTHELHSGGRSRPVTNDNK